MPTNPTAVGTAAGRVERASGFTDCMRCVVGVSEILFDGIGKLDPARFVYA